MKAKTKGVYRIFCKANNKSYIGSSSKSIISRFNNHESTLNNNKHKNTHLQNSWNKYGSENFIFEILEEVSEKKNVLQREDYWINYYKAYDREYGFNINPYATGGNQFSKETIAKRNNSIKERMQEALHYYYKVKSGEITLEDVPDKHKKQVEYRLGNVIWNKGKTKNEINYSFLKNVKKTITEKVLISRKNNRENKLNNSIPILVYNALGNLIKEFRSACDIEEFSKNNPNYFPLMNGNSGRNGIPNYVLKYNNIIENCRGGSKHYKGLLFRYKNSDLPVVALTMEDFSRNRKLIEKEYCRLKEQSLSENSGKNLES
jgi:group I intron endonuclease